MMKRIFRVIGLGALSAVILPLFLALFFAMPIEFAVATWHNLRVDSSVKGSISDSRVTYANGSLEGSSISYSYKVNGVSYESSRWKAGLFTNSKQDGGGIYARNHKEGASVDIFYSKDDPSFSLLERGWPKWSLAFSMIVWGIVLSNCFKRSSPRTLRLLIVYPISRALTTVGFLTIMIFPPILTLSAIGNVMIIFTFVALCALIWLLLGRTSPANTTP